MRTLLLSLFCRRLSMGARFPSFFDAANIASVDAVKQLDGRIPGEEIIIFNWLDRSPNQAVS
jgi:hypothetical protein